MSTVQHADPTTRPRTRRRPGPRRARRDRAPPPRGAAEFRHPDGLARDLPGASGRSAAMNVDPVLFTSPCQGRGRGGRHDRERRTVGRAVAEPARAGDGADARHHLRHAARPGAGALPHSRRRPHRLHHLPLFDPVGGARAADRAVGRLRDHRQGHHPVPVRVLPDGHQHLSGREVGRPRSCSKSAARSAARSGSCGPTSCCPARCRSSSPASASRSAAA